MQNMNQQAMQPQPNPEYVQYVLQRTGTTIERCAEDVARAGFGDYNEIVQRLRQGDVTVLTNYANWVKSNNPQAWQQATSACHNIFGQR